MFSLLDVFECETQPTIYLCIYLFNGLLLPQSFAQNVSFYFTFWNFVGLYSSHHATRNTASDVTQLLFLFIFPFLNLLSLVQYKNTKNWDGKSHLDVFLQQALFLACSALPSLTRHAGVSWMEMNGDGFGPKEENKTRLWAQRLTS